MQKRTDFLTTHFPSIVPDIPLVIRNKPHNNQLCTDLSRLISAYPAVSHFLRFAWQTTTTAAVAHKMNRRYIGIEMGDHAYTHCKTRLDKIIAGTDKGGVTEATGWKRGGGYRFFELAPSLINRDPFDEYVINEDYDANMLAAAVALHEGFRYQPDSSLFWKQSVGNENSYLFVTTRHLNSTYLDSIKDTMEDGEYLIIACRSFDSGLDKAYDNITVKKIPQMLLERCEFGKVDYNLNIVHPPVYDDCDEEEENV